MALVRFYLKKYPLQYWYLFKKKANQSIRSSIVKSVVFSPVQTSTILKIGSCCNLYYDIDI